MADIQALSGQRWTTRPETDHNLRCPLELGKHLAALVDNQPSQDRREPTGPRMMMGGNAGWWTRLVVLAAVGFWATLASDAAAQGSVETDRAALEALYDQTDGENWTNSTNWKTSAPLGEWYGVGTTSDGRVTWLDLTNNQLTGPIPAELARLERLMALRVSANQLTGPIPASLGSLTRLRVLSISFNKLTGPLPAELANLVGLEELYASGNHLMGPIPTWLDRLHGLRGLQLGRGFTGSIPAWLSGLKNLKWLDLAFGDFTGPIPPELGRLENLLELRLPGNDLTGPIPVELGHLGNLEVLELARNDLTGPIPVELGHLGNLEVLELAWNDLTGPIPAELGGLESLRVLNLEYTGLSGPIPVEMADLGNLEELNLGFNDLTGPIPVEMGHLESLRVLDLEYTGLSGPIPAELGRLENLEELTLRWIGLTGPLPVELGGLVNLTRLSLGGNGLTGPIPPEFVDLVNLQELDLFGNWGLTGPLPTGLRESELEDLDIFLTQACAPVAWWDWLEKIDFWGAPCEEAGTEVNIDLAVVYTPAAREAAGSVAAVEAEIQLMVTETNSAYAASGVAQRLTLVALSEVAYTESGDGSVDLDRLVDPEDGALDGVHDLRDRVGADLVHLIIEEAPGICGIARLPGAFGVTVRRCGGVVFAHELGHNMGLFHDRLQVQANEGWVASHPAYGYVNRRMFEAGAAPSSHWTTIMAYSNHCGLADVDCPRLLRFSNPRQHHLGDPLGIPFGVDAPPADGPADSAAVLNATGRAVAAWRDGVAGPNRPPTAVGTLADQSLALEGKLILDVSSSFTDPDGDLLTYSISSSAPRVATVLATGAHVTLTAVSVGRATIAVTATDPGGSSATQSFAVTVEPKPGEVASEREVLEALYEVTGGSRWRNSTNWKSSAPLGEWYGVTTDADDRVTNLNLSYNGLAGELPAELGALENLRVLQLPWNDLRGPLPAELGDLENLEGLFLLGNGLAGPIPAELGRLENLIALELPWNKLTGAIPAALGRLANLERLRLDGNGLNGPIPAALGSLRNLTRLSLDRNDLTGSIPPGLGSLTHLKKLTLSRNWSLSGQLPTGLRESGLEELDIFLTQACAPAAWLDWLATIDFLGAPCETPSGVTVDVAVVYTPAARAAAGGVAAIEAEIDVMVAETNQAYAASGVGQRLALVARSEVAYTETGSGDVDLDRLTNPADGHLDEVHDLRDQVGADLVHLIVSRAPGICGIAVLSGPFSLTVIGCGGIDFAHELGHSMGLEHDRFEVLLNEGAVSPHPAYGYVNRRMFEAGAPLSSRWSTIMAYRTHCNLARVFRCPILPRFSNSRQSYAGDRLGVPYGGDASGVDGAADSAAVLNATGPAVALWRDRVSRPNRPPSTVGTLADQSMSVGGRLSLDVSPAFVDPDGDPLIYTVSSSAPQVATVVATGARVMLTAAGVGRATIAVTATDPGGLSATQSFMVTVAVTVPFTDDPLVPGVTPVKAVHFTELRTRIDSLRVAAGLARFAWTDPVLTAGVTRVRLVHLLELRSALAAAYAAWGRPLPSWTDTSPMAGALPIRAAHLMELRAAVIALE